METLLEEEDEEGMKVVTWQITRQMPKIDVGTCVCVCVCERDKGCLYLRVEYIKI
jgi:hypothetical protein